MNILTVLSVPVHEQRITLYLFRYFISFISCFSFPHIDLVHTLLDVYLSLFWGWCYCEWYWFCFNFGCSLLICRNTVDFYTLTLYLVTLLNSYIGSRRYFYGGFSTITTRLPVTEYSFIYSFLFYIPFISFSCIIALARSSSTTLKKSGKENILAFFQILEGKHSVSHH